MKKFLKVFAIALIVVAALTVIFGWNFFRLHYLGKIVHEVKNQPYIAFVGGNIYNVGDSIKQSSVIRKDIMLYDTNTGRRIVLPLSLSNDIDSRIAVSSDGKIYYVCGKDYLLHRFDLKTMVDALLLPSKNVCINPACSHDGRHVVFEANLTNQQGYRDIYCLDLANMNNTAQRLTSSLTFCGSPSYTADDKHVVYDCRDAMGNVSLWIMNSNGGNQHALINGGAVGNFQRPACSPVNSWIAYQINLGGSIGISASLMDRNQNITRTVVVVNDGQTNLNPCWSSDGKKIVFQKKSDLSIGVNTFVDNDIYEVDFNPDLPQVSAPMIARPILNDLYAHWLPTMGDSVQNSIARAFIASFQKIQPSARKDLN